MLDIHHEIIACTAQQRGIRVTPDLLALCRERLSIATMSHPDAVIEEIAQAFKDYDGTKALEELWPLMDMPRERRI